MFLIADDSMGGRDTPSRGLDLTARYVASEFKASCPAPTPSCARSTSSSPPTWITSAPAAAARTGPTRSATADDNASGTTGGLELAEAFANRAAAPKRSLIFVTVSGEERGLWGSQYVAEHPPVPIGQIVANIDMDHLGRSWRDSIVVIGTEHSSLGAVVTGVRQAHPELNVSPLPDQWFCSSPTDSTPTTMR